MKNILRFILIGFIILIFILFRFKTMEGNQTMYSYKPMGNVDYPGNDISNDGRTVAYKSSSLNRCINDCGNTPDCVGIVSNTKDHGNDATCWFKRSMTTSTTPNPSEQRYAYNVTKDSTKMNI